MRVADGEPGAECQLDFGNMGLLEDREAGRREVHALIFTACYSAGTVRVDLSFPQDLACVYRRVRRGVGVLRRGV